MGDVYDDYVLLLERFTQHEMSADEFQAAYLKMFKSEGRQLGGAVFKILDTLFGDVDAFCADPGLRSELEAQNPGFYLNEEQLRRRVVLASQQLQALRVAGGL